MKQAFLVTLLISIFCSSPVLAICPSMDFTGDCTVSLEDFAIFAAQWLDSPGPYVPDIQWVYICDTGSGMESGYETYGGFSGWMAKHEITNAQYCLFLNAALDSGDIIYNRDHVYGAQGSNLGKDFIGQIYYDTTGPGCDGNQITNGGAARIYFNGISFRVDRGYEDHPVTYVSWYGATAFCNYYGWRLPTEWEWQAVADYCFYEHPYTYTYGCGYNINIGIANYYDAVNQDGTTPVGSYGEFGYGMCDMAGNAEEWTSTVIETDYRMFRGGAWNFQAYACTVYFRDEFGVPDLMNCFLGFRPCR